MHVRQILRTLGFAGAIALASDGAFGARLGHAGTSVKGATNAQNQVNLISDPPDAQSGTITSTYDPSILSISTVTAEPGFFINQVVVQTTNGYDTFGFGDSSDVTIGALDGAEVGAVQVSFDPDPSTTPIQVPDGVDDSGNTIYGDLTHFISFNLTDSGLAQEQAGTPTDPLTTVVTDTASLGGGDPGTGDNSVGTFAAEDTYTTVDGTSYNADGTTTNPDGSAGPDQTFENSSDDVAVVAPSNVTPEPSSACLLGISGMLLLVRRRRANEVSASI
jgi:hypothetical protein